MSTGGLDRPDRSPCTDEFLHFHTLCVIKCLWNVPPAVGLILSYCAAKLVTGTSKRKENKISWPIGCHTVYKGQLQNKIRPVAQGVERPVGFHSATGLKWCIFDKRYILFCSLGRSSVCVTWWNQYRAGRPISRKILLCFTMWVARAYLGSR